MKNFILLNVILILFFQATAQSDQSPKSWEGNWKGTLQIFNSNTTQDIPVSLQIQPKETNQWNFILHYEIEGQSPREYELINVDNDWKIDEKNGVVLALKKIGNRYATSFSVSDNTIICYYWIENSHLLMELHTISEKDKTSSLTDDKLFEIQHYQVISYQKGRLIRQ